MDPDQIIDDAAYVRALGHPLRLRILAMLEEEPSSPARLAEALGSNPRVVDYHVKRLQHLGLVHLVGRRPTRGAPEHLCRARPHPTFSDDAWEALEGDAKSALLISTLRQMSAYVNRSAVAGGFDRADAHFSRKAITVDREGWRALAAASRDWLDRVAQIEREVAVRDGDETFDAGVVVLVFEAARFSDRPPLRP